MKNARKSKTPIRNRLAEIRKSRGLAASDLARRVEVSRQTIYAVEAGTYVPNTELALRLARELEVAVDDLFSLAGESSGRLQSVSAEVLSGATPETGRPVRIGQVGSRWIGVPVSAAPSFMPEADGMIKRAPGANSRAEVVVFGQDEAARRRLVLAGCDPAIGLLS